MPVTKFRSIEEMNAAPIVCESGDAGFERFLRHCARMRRLSARQFPRGVFRFQTIEEAQAARRQFDRPASS
jgi:hypothetical protein